MLEKSCQRWLIWYLLFFCHGGAEEQLQWVVKEKVTGYGQNLILLCPVENCCIEPAGWDVGPNAIILDVKTFSNDPKVKYHGTYNKDGFGVVIHNLSEADLNVTYRCVYGFDQSTPKYLLHDDVFRDNVPDKDKEIDTTAFGVPILVIMVGFTIGIMIYCVYRSRNKQKRQKQIGTDKENEAFYRSDIQIENKQDEPNRTKEMEDTIYIHAPISYGTKEIVEMQTGHSKGLDRLGRGSFKIKPSAYRMATLFMSGLAGAWVRWSECNSKYTNFTFRKTIVDGKTYFHIFSADYPEYYVKMGKISFWVSCVKGNPEGCNDATWEIKCGDYNNDYCYVLCPKDSNDNYLSAGSTYRIHGRRGDINDRSMFFIH